MEQARDKGWLGNLAKLAVTIKISRMKPIRGSCQPIVPSVGAVYESLTRHR
jgi:hypothetical protein